MQDIIDDVTQYLSLTHEVKDPSGIIDIGDKFTLTFTITNTAPPRTNVSIPAIRFVGLYLSVYETRYARPHIEGSDTVSSAVGDDFFPSSIRAGESATVDMTFVAISAITNPVSLVIEKVADAIVNASLDFEEYFQISKEFEVSTNIFPRINVGRPSPVIDRPRRELP
ncbi:hypothetical protein [Echinimonas agarilytica]|uniref:DUF11 domain-containing protein n=1 Tax=Echinimonas agarilytica TaxID=1215918 RepID=A0AA42B8E9_9GAMM|nr:hypothetical protein [Echinimonas agarilytica]MCM2680782.1 hypothetical protein [Echinimonas agarilytica]